jgi:hypothetical protein
MQTLTIAEGKITTEAQLDKKLMDTSKKNPKNYITYTVSFGEVWIYIHDRKPQSTSTHGAENTYRQHGGFLKNGKWITPSASFIARYEYCPILN